MKIVPHTGIQHHAPHHRPLQTRAAMGPPPGGVHLLPAWAMGGLVVTAAIMIGVVRPLTTIISLLVPRPLSLVNPIMAKVLLTDATAMEVGVEGEGEGVTRTALALGVDQATIQGSLALRLLVPLLVGVVLIPTMVLVPLQGLLVEQVRLPVILVPQRSHPDSAMPQLVRDLREILQGIELGVVLVLVVGMGTTLVDLREPGPTQQEAELHTGRLTARGTSERWPVRIRIRVQAIGTFHLQEGRDTAEEEVGGEEDHLGEGKRITPQLWGATEARGAMPTVQGAFHLEVLHLVATVADMARPPEE